MQKYKLLIFSAILSLIPILTTRAQNYPKPTGFVNDFANVLTQEQGKSLNDVLIDFEKKTTIEISVVTIANLNNQSIESYTLGLANEWGVGKSSKNNGIVFLIAPNERKMRIEVGSGITHLLTNRERVRIRDNIIIPCFSEQNMSQGVINGTHAIIKSIQLAQSKPATGKSDDKSTDSFSGIFIYTAIGIVLLTVILILISIRVQNIKTRKRVLKEKERLRKYCDSLEKISKDPDVKEETSKKLMDLKKKLTSIEQELVDKKVDWRRLEGKIHLLEMSLWYINTEMSRDMEFAQRARLEGPKLMEKIPEMIKNAEKKISEGKESDKARKYLEQAQTQYAKAEAKKSGMSTIDWVILFIILSSAQSHIGNATSAHNSLNHPKDMNDDYRSSGQDDSKTNKPDDSNQYGFGNLGGLGGGNFGGDGTSGSW